MAGTRNMRKAASREARYGMPGLPPTRQRGRKRGGKGEPRTTDLSFFSGLMGGSHRLTKMTHDLNTDRQSVFVSLAESQRLDGRSQARGGSWIFKMHPTERASYLCSYFDPLG